MPTEERATAYFKMGTPVTPARNMIYYEGSQFRNAVSEDLIQRLGSSINFINNYQYSEKQFFLNGPYSNLPSYPQTFSDGLVFFQYDAEIVNVFAFSITKGVSGTTELDVKRATSSGGAFTSIFSTTPKFTSACSNNVWTDSAGLTPVQTGITRPVLATVNLNAGDALRVDLISAMQSAYNTGLVIIYRPR